MQRTGITADEKKEGDSSESEMENVEGDQSESEKRDHAAELLHVNKEAELMLQQIDADTKNANEEAKKKADKEAANEAKKKEANEAKKNAKEAARPAAKANVEEENPEFRFGALFPFCFLHLMLATGTAI